MTNRLAASATRIQSHRDLIVWQKTRILNAASYNLARTLPPEENFGLKAQIQRAAVSIAANIAEGHGKFGKAEFCRHLSIARGSLMELECLIELGADVGYYNADRIKAPLDVADEVGKMLWALLKKLGSRQLLPRGGGYAPRPDRSLKAEG